MCVILRLNRCDVTLDEDVSPRLADTAGGPVEQHLLRVGEIAQPLHIPHTPDHRGHGGTTAEAPLLAAVLANLGLVHPLLAKVALDLLLGHGQPK